MITRPLIYMTAVLFLSAYTVEMKENQSISKGEKQSNSTVSGIYEFQTSFLYSIANFKSDGTFEMSYQLGGDKQETSGTWTIEEDRLILKNEGNFPANKKWLIGNEKLYPIVKSGKKYDMDLFYVLKKD